MYETSVIVNKEKLAKLLICNNFKGFFKKESRLYRYKPELDKDDGFWYSFDEETIGIIKKSGPKLSNLIDKVKAEITKLQYGTVVSEGPVTIYSDNFLDDIKI